MDKRTILGVILIFLVLVIWQFIMRPKQERKEPVPVSTEREVPEQVVAQEEVAQEVIKPAEQAAVLDTVDTSLMQVVLTSVGASIQSVKLKHYEAPDSGWVELIPPAHKSLEDVFLTKGAIIDLSDEVFKVSERGERQIAYEYTLPSGGKVEKIYSFPDSSYLFDLSIRVPKDAEPQIKKHKIIWNSGLASTEKRKEMTLRYFGGLASLGGTVVLKGINSLDTIPKGEPGAIDWVGAKNKYFLAAIVPGIETESYALKRFARINVGGGCACGLTPPLKNLDAIRVGISLITKSRAAYNYRIYTGPLDYDMLRGLGLGLEDACYFGFKWIRPISRFFLKIFLTLHKVIPNYGIVIIIFSFLVTIVFFPLTKISHKSMAGMRDLQPKLQALQKKYKNDPKRLNQETMALYRKRGVSPFSGCLPLLIQMPVFFALYAILDTTIALRGALFIPHWIEDLSQPDKLFGTFPIPILPLFMGGMMFVQQKLGGPMGGGMGGGMGGDATQQKMMKYFFPIFLTVIFLRFPSGLVLYWFIYNVFSIIQTQMIKKSGDSGTPKLSHKVHTH